MDQIKFYINPEIYKAENQVNDEFTHYNTKFEEQSEKARKTGEIEPDELMAQVIKEDYERSKKEHKVMRLVGPEGIENTIEKDDELG